MERELSKMSVIELLTRASAYLVKGGVTGGVEDELTDRFAEKDAQITTLTSALAAEKARGERLAVECREHRSDMGERDLVSDSCAEAMKAVDAARDLEAPNE